MDHHGASPSYRRGTACSVQMCSVLHSSGNRRLVAFPTDVGTPDRRAGTSAIPPRITTSPACPPDGCRDRGLAQPAPVPPPKPTTYAYQYNDVILCHNEGAKRPPCPNVYRDGYLKLSHTHNKRLPHSFLSFAVTPHPLSPRMKRNETPPPVTARSEERTTWRSHEQQRLPRHFVPRSDTLRYHRERNGMKWIEAHPIVTTSIME